MRRSLLFFCLFSAAVSLAAYDFPARGGRIAAAFGSEEKGEFCTGIEIEAHNVFASESGEVLYRSGDYVAIAHENSILTIYSDLAVSESLSKDIHIEKGELLGSAKGGRFRFAVYDLEMERYINPLLMTEDIKESELPKVSEIYYDADQGILSVQLDARELLGLYKVQISAGGQVLSTLGFRTIRREGDLLLLDSEGFRCGTLYGRQGAFSFPGIHLDPGYNNIDVIVTDFYGKKVEFHGRITV